MEKGRRTERKSQPILPGYIVAKMEPVQFPVLREVEDVSPRPLMAGGEARPLKPVERAYIGQLVRKPPADPRDPFADPKNPLAPPRKKPDPNRPPFRQGQEVKVVKAGAFFGFSAAVEELKRTGKKWKAKVAVMIFGRPTPLDLDATDLVAA